MGLQENRDVITSFWNEGYQSVISSLLKLDDVQGAEAIWRILGSIKRIRVGGCSNTGFANLSLLRER